MVKRIALLATGGTIASTRSKAGYLPTLGAADLIAGLQFPCELVPRDVFCLDSSNMQPEEWRVLAQAVDESLKDCDGAVITHGTDTMAYTSSMLSFMLAGVEKPVILTGAQIPIAEPLSDARGNLRRAIAAAMQTIRGVYVCFDQKTHTGHAVRENPYHGHRRVLQHQRAARGVFRFGRPPRRKPAALYAV